MTLTDLAIRTSQLSPERVRSDGGAHLGAVRLYNTLTGDRFGPEVTAATAAEVVTVAGHDLAWITAMPRELWDELPLAGHEIAPPTDCRRTALGGAVEHLVDRHPHGAALFRTFVHGLVWVDLAEGANQTLLTSSSLPVLPYWVFVSRKSQRHIPPNTVAQTPSVRFLAENLYHEAIHQVVNINLLTADVFLPEFDSATAPRIEIPWRAAGGDVRNQFWELDRTLHAVTVYRHLLAFRAVELDDPALSPEERACFETAAAAGREAFEYLVGALRHHGPPFMTQLGLDILAESGSAPSR